MAKLRLFRLPELLAGAFVLALLGVVSGRGGRVNHSAYASALGLSCAVILLCAVVTAVAPVPATRSCGPSPSRVWRWRRWR